MNAPSDRPSVTIKLATSLDGRIATASGESKWITGEAARAQVHRLRAAHDAVLAGAGTALADDPELTARTEPRPERQPLRIIADGRGRLPATARVFQTLELGPVAIATQEPTDLEARDWPSLPGVQYWMLPAGEGGAGVDLAALLDIAQGGGVGSIFVEGGGEMAAGFVRAGLVDRIEWFRAPILLGADGRAAMGPLGLERLALAPHFVRTRCEALGPDLWETYERADVRS